MPAVFQGHRNIQSMTSDMDDDLANKPRNPKLVFVSLNALADPSDVLEPMDDCDDCDDPDLPIGDGDGGGGGGRRGCWR